MVCPGCGEEMAAGALAMNGARLSLASAVWEPEARTIGSAKKLLEPGPLGLHTRPAWRCPTCETVLIPPSLDPPAVPLRAIMRGGVARPDRDVDQAGTPAHTASAPPAWENFERTDDDPLRR